MVVSNENEHPSEVEAHSTSKIQPTTAADKTKSGAMPHTTISDCSIDSTAKTDLDFNHTFYPSQNKHTEANIFPEPSVVAEADLEKNGLAPKPQGTDPADFPDGGAEAWLVVLGAWCGLFCSFGWLNSIGIFQEHYQYNQLSRYSPSIIAWIPSMELFIMFFEIGRAHV